MKINNNLRRLVIQALAEALSESPLDASSARSRFRHNLRRTTRLTMAQCTWVWHSLFPRDSGVLDEYIDTPGIDDDIKRKVREDVDTLLS